MQDNLRKTPSIRVVPGAPTEPKAFLEWSSRQPEGFRYELSRGQVTEMMIEGRNETVPLPRLGIELSMAALYLGVPDPN